MDVPAEVVTRALRRPDDAEGMNDVGNAVRRTGFAAVDRSVEDRKPFA